MDRKPTIEDWKRLVKSVETNSKEEKLFIKRLLELSLEDWEQMVNSLEEETNGTEVKRLIKRLLELWKGEDKYDGPEKRNFARLVYPSSKRPTLKIKEHELEVIDISEEGLKLLNPMQKGFGEKVYGTVALLSGKSIDITGKIVWQAEGTFGLLTTRIPSSTIIEEIRTLLRIMGSSGPD